MATTSRSDGYDQSGHTDHFLKLDNNRDRLLGGGVAADLFDALSRQACPAGLLSDEHFALGCMQLEA